MKTIVSAGILAFGAILFPACNQADNAVDCVAICDRYKTCFDSKYDTAKCVSRCTDQANDEGYATKADACSNCIDDKSCTSATFTCTADCVGIVP